MPARTGKGAEQSGTPQTVDCPADATAVDLPADFPAPLPEGAVVVAVDERDDGRTVVTAVVPAAEPDVLADLQAAYADAGLTLTEGETEERDAESNFTGDGVTGRWGIRELSDCSGCGHPDRPRRPEVLTGGSRSSSTRASSTAAARPPGAVGGGPQPARPAGARRRGRGR